MAGVGLVPVPAAPLHVADAGSLGGGMPVFFAGCSCGCGLDSSGRGPCFRVCGVCDVWFAALDEARLQPLKLSLRRSEEDEEGVSGSVEVDVCTDSAVFFFCKGRGPATMLCISTSLFGDLYSPLRRGCILANSPLPFGNELDAKGVVVCLFGFRVGTGMVPMFGCVSSGDSVARRLNAELLLRKCLWYSSWLGCLEKKLALEAVMGVLGVLAAVRFGGGVTLPSSASSKGKADNRLLKGVPRGSRLSGGNLIGCKFFLLDCCTGVVLSGSGVLPTVKPLRCLMDPVRGLIKGASGMSF